MDPELHALRDHINVLIETGFRLADELGQTEAWAAIHEDSSDNVRDEIIDLRDRFDWYMRDLYWSVMRMLEMENLPQLMRLAQRRLGAPEPSANLLQAFATDADSSSYRNGFLTVVLEILRSFRFRDQDSQLRQLIGLEHLERILRNSASLIHQLGITVSSEPAVYKAVKAAIISVFPTAINADANFNKIVQKFKPDILVPEVGAVIEYKYADNEEKLKDFFTQLAGDEKGYTGDSQYSHYYSVVYVTTDFWGQQRFDAAWKQMGFIPAWKALYVVGSGTSVPKAKRPPRP